MKNYLTISLILLALLTACKENNKEQAQPLVLEKNSGFKLEKIDFKEDVFQLFSKILSIDGIRYDPEIDGKLDIEKLDFRCFESITMNIQIPKEKYGYEFYAYKDSVAQFENAYFKEIKMLTKRDTSLVAVWASGDYITEKADLDSIMQQLKSKYGEPEAEYDLGMGFDVYAYQWSLKDRLIQLETSRGFSVRVTTESDEPQSIEYYKIEVLIVKQSEVAGLMKACTLSYQDIQEHEKYQIKEDMIEMGCFKIYSQIPRYQYANVMSGRSDTDEIK